MKIKHLFFNFAVMAVSASVLFIACSKNMSSEGTVSGSGTQSVSLFMTDGPGVYNHVYLDIKSISVLVDTSTNTRRHDGSNWDYIGTRHSRPDSSFVWDSLNVKAGLYDLLQLRNGVDTLLATSTIAAGSIRLIRINLGTNNYLVKDSVSHPLHIPTGATTYILMKLMGDEWEHFAVNSSRLWLDFDITRSIISFNNDYYLYPFIKTFVVNKTGSISGRILPEDALPESVSIYGNSDTAYALPNWEGNFKVRGLKDGTYRVHISAASGYRDTTINNVIISNAGNVTIGTMTLHK
jgi:hypothetical protein